MRAKLLIALSFVGALSLDGCISFVDRGTRGGKITPLLALNVVRQGDKREDVIKTLGEPDEVGQTAAGSERLTYRSCQGGYYCVFGQFDYYELQIQIENGAVVKLNGQQTAHDTHILTGFYPGIREPSYK